MNEQIRYMTERELATQWNQHADEYNQWDALGMDEKLEFAQQASHARYAGSGEASATAGMNLGERIAHVGGRENEQGYVEFGSPMAVKAMIDHLLRDIARPPAQPKVPDGYKVEHGSAAYKEILVTAPDGGQQWFWPDDAAYGIFQAILSAQENNK